MQLILEPGFSTAGASPSRPAAASAWTWSATEVKQLGGALHMETTAGERRPLHRFACRSRWPSATRWWCAPARSSTLCRCRRSRACCALSRDEVAAHLRPRAATFELRRPEVPLAAPGAVCGSRALAAARQDVTIPVVLVRAGEHSTGLVADELVGSREIVVKPVGPQISRIRGISGATILSDGRIVIILDIGALVRSGWRGRSAPTVTRDKVDLRTLALVVDDSITVRRVTQRLLERNGMRVLTARDGMDAVTLLTDHVPDIILLDIEMPRMDGYELAAHVRNDPRLRDIPIIMITSRVGEKHRARAIELGVNDYLGKPYQESELIDAITPLVAKRRAAGHLPGSNR